jgi:hypothetical protein
MWLRMERLAEASEEGQGPHRTVEPMIMMKATGNMDYKWLR